MITDVWSIGGPLGV